jgi:hypothetical protein
MVQDKTDPKVASPSTNVSLLPPDEAPDQHCLSKLLQITMCGLWGVLFNLDLAQKRERKALG